MVSASELTFEYTQHKQHTEHHWLFLLMNFIYQIVLFLKFCFHVSLGCCTHHLVPCGPPFELEGRNSILQFFRGSMQEKLLGRFFPCSLCCLILLKLVILTACGCLAMCVHYVFCV